MSNFLRTVKVFLKLKLDEIKEPFFIVVAVYSIVCGVITLTYWILDFQCKSIIYHSGWQWYVGGICFAFWFVVVVVIFCQWIRDNWREAKRIVERSK